jgi:hypothetical protein
MITNSALFYQIESICSVNLTPLDQASTTPHCGLTFTCLQIMGVCLVVALCLAIMFVLVQI